MIRRCKDLAEELLGSNGVPAFREIEVEGSAGRVHGSIEVGPTPTDPNVSSTRQEVPVRFSCGPHPPVEFRSVALHQRQTVV